MKRGVLCGAIRKVKGNVSAVVPGVGQVLIQKGSLVAALIEGYPGKGDETGMTLNDDGVLVPEGLRVEGGCCDPAYRDDEPEQLDIEDAIAAAADDDDIL